MKAKIWCRDCGKEMKQYPYDLSFFYCKECKLKASVVYEKMNTLKACEGLWIKKIMEYILEKTTYL